MMANASHREIPHGLLEEFFERLGLVLERCVEVGDGVAITARWSDATPPQHIVVERTAALDLSDPGQLHALEVGEVSFSARETAD